MCRKAWEFESPLPHEPQTLERPVTASRRSLLCAGGIVVAKHPERVRLYRVQHVSIFGGCGHAAYEWE